MSDQQAEAKAWRMRNSDGRNTFEGERTQEPPTFDLIPAPFPAPAVFPPNPNAEDDSGYEPGAILHHHVWDPSLVDPDAAPETLVAGLMAEMGIGTYDGHGNGPGAMNGEELIVGMAPADGDGDGHALDERASGVQVVGDD